jgi:hypothetical protein
MLAHANRAGVGVPCPKIWTLPVSKIEHRIGSLTTEATAATCFGKAHATVASEERHRTCKLNRPAWHKPDAETLFEIGSGKLLTTLAATEIPVFQRL